MARPRSKPVSPDQVIRELRAEFRRLTTKEEPGPERAALLATFTRAAHDERQLNMAMHAASLCLEEDPTPPELLHAAYLPPDLEDTEERLRALVDLGDLARYVDARELVDRARDERDGLARDWVREVADPERRHRLRTLGSMVDQAYADQLRDELEFL